MGNTDSCLPGNWKAGALDAAESAAEVPEAAAEELVADGFGLPPAAFTASGVVPSAEAEGEGADVDAESAAAVPVAVAAAVVPKTTEEGTAETPWLHSAISILRWYPSK